MAINLGSAYVDIVPSTANLAPKLRNDLERPLEQSAARASRGFGDRFTSGLAGLTRNLASSVGGAVTSAVSSAASAAMRGLETTAAASGALVASSLISGYSRMTTIQDATMALTISLGDATEAASLLDDVLGVVRGTPFNLDQFAAAAQRMVGFGVEVEKIPTYLTAIGEAAATQGRNANDFADRLAVVFGQIAASGQVSLADVWRISDTGVNALTILGNAFGETTEEMKKLITKGAVPADKALDALAKGIVEGSDGVAGSTKALAGTMEALRGTLTGAVGGFGAARARFGAAILTPLSEGLRGVAIVATEVMDTLGEQIGARMTRLVESDGWQRFAWWIVSIPSRVEALIPKLRELGPALAPLGAALAALSLGGLSTALGPFGAIIPTINPVVAAFAAWVVTNDELRESFGNLGSALWDAFQRIRAAAAPIGEALGSAFSDALVRTVDWLAETGVPAVAAFVSDALEKLSGWWAEHGESVISGVKTMGEAFRDVVAPAIDAVKSAIELAMPVLGSLVTWAVENENVWEAMGFALGVLAVVMVGHYARIGLAAIASSARAVAAAAANALAWNGMAANAERNSARIATAWTGMLGPMALVIAGAETINKLTGEKLNPHGLSLWERLDPRKAFKGLSFGLPSISAPSWMRMPWMNDGGVMPGLRGQHSLAWVAGGETILPTHKMDFDSAVAAVGGEGGGSLVGGDLIVQQMPGEDAGTATYRALRRLSALRG